MSVNMLMEGSDANMKVLEVSEPWGRMIIDEIKKVEVRKNDPSKWGATKVGDHLNVKGGPHYNGPFEVVDVRTYKTLDDCIIAEGVRNLLPGKQTLYEAKEIYECFDGSDLDARLKRIEDYAHFGCIAIELRPLEVAVNIDLQTLEKEWKKIIESRDK